MCWGIRVSLFRETTSQDLEHDQSGYPTEPMFSSGREDATATSVLCPRHRSDAVRSKVRKPFTKQAYGTQMSHSLNS